MLFARINLRALAWGAVVGLLFGFAPGLGAAGVTLITHGNSSSTSGWITGMANSLSARLGGSVPIYRINVASGLATSVTKISGGNPLTTMNGEVILMLDWGPVSNNGTNTFAVAAAVAPLFSQTNLIAELGGHALAEFPIHVMGHSRGGSLVCELSKKLGESGLWVDQVTGLDTHPISGDAPVATYENVLFADSYYQSEGFPVLLNGEAIPGSFWRRQTVISGGYSFPYDGHSDVHLWYHGTIDLATPAYNSESGISITSTMRSQWWTAPEQQGTNAGFIYTRLGGGNRFSVVQPNGANSSAIRAGISQRFEFGAGVTNNRTALSFNSGDWPNVIQLTTLATNPVAQGESALLHIDFQWAVSIAQTQAVQVFLDLDRNPLNGNEQLLLAGTASGTTSSQVGSGTITVPLDATNAPAGNYAVFVKLTGGGRSRMLYAPTGLTVVPSRAAPWLDISDGGAGSVTVGVNGVAGQTVVVQQSADFSAWQSFGTNTLAANRWELSRPADGSNSFYRAILLP